MDIQVNYGATLRSLVEVKLARTDPLLLIGAVEEGSIAVFQGSPWPIRRVPNVLEFCLRQFSVDAGVVICDDELPDGTWRDVVNLIGALRTPPPLIVTSRLANDRLWAEVLNMGAFDLLAKPLDSREVDRVIKLAWGRTCGRESMPPKVRDREDGSESARLNAVGFAVETEGMSIRPRH